MADFMKKATGNWQDGLMLLLGIWLFFSPWILGFAGIQSAFWNALLFGVILAGMSIAVATGGVALALAAWSLRHHHAAHAA